MVNFSALSYYLEEWAKKGTPVHYIDVTEHFELPVPRNWGKHELRPLFEMLDQEDVDKRRPFRTSLVIRKREQLPGNGFFKSLAEKTGRTVNADLDKESLHKAEMEAAIRYFRG